MTRRSLALIAPAALLLLAACGGDDAPKKAATAEEGDAFCKAAEDFDEDYNDLDLTVLSPDEAEEAYGDAIADFTKVVGLAPTDIADTAGDLLDAQTDIGELLEDADWDLIAVLSEPDAEELFDKSDDLGDEFDDYVADKCGVDTSDDDSDTDDTIESGTDDTIAEGTDETIPSGLITRDNFLDLYAIGTDAEITDEMKDCFADATADLSDEDFEAAVNGTGDEATTVAIGIAILECNIPVTGLES